MKANRQDAWTKEEDQLLANTVLDYIKNGQTQLESFKQVAKQLNRTPAACGFRWNATIRKRYTNAIEKAKESRKKNQYIQEHEQLEHLEANSSISTLDQAIQWLEKLRNDPDSDLRPLDPKVNQQLMKENERLYQELSVYETLINNIKKLIDDIQ